MQKDEWPPQDNPIVELVLRFKDGAALRQVFATPVPQSRGMPALGRMVADLGAELDIQLPEERTYPRVTDWQYREAILHLVGLLPSSQGGGSHVG